MQSRTNPTRPVCGIVCLAVATIVGGCGGDELVAEPATSTPTPLETEPTTASTPTAETDSTALSTRNTLGTEPTTASTPTTVDVADSTPEPSAESIEPVPTRAKFDERATPVPATDLGPSERLVPGAYRVDTIGVPLSFVIPDAPALLVYRIDPENGAVTLGATTTSGGSDRVITIDRPAALNEPDRLGDEPGRGDGWSPTDIEPWLDALVGADVVERDRVDVGGYPTIKFRLTLGDGADCSDGPFCQHFGFDASETATTETLVWWIMPPDADPVRISAQALDAIDADAWFGAAASIVRSIGFGPVADGSDGVASEGPCSDQLAQGMVTIGVADGLAFDVGDEERFVLQPVPCSLAVVTGQDPNQQISIMVAGTGPVGETVSTAADVVEILERQGVDLAELGGAEVGGIEARVFDVGGEEAEPADPALGWYLIAAGADPADPMQNGWDAPSVGKLWLLESERGVIMVTAAAFGLGTGAPDIVAEGDQLIASLELI